MRRLTFLCSAVISALISSTAFAQVSEPSYRGYTTERVLSLGGICFAKSRNDGAAFMDLCEKVMLQMTSEREFNDVGEENVPNVDRFVRSAIYAEMAVVSRTVRKSPSGPYRASSCALFGSAIEELDAISGSVRAMGLSPTDLDKIRGDYLEQMSSCPERYLPVRR